MSSTDNILAAVGGGLEGMRDVLVPFFQLRTKAVIDQELEKQKFEREKSLVPWKMGLETQQKDALLKKEYGYKTALEERKASLKPGMTPIYGADGEITGYTKTGGKQFITEKEWRERNARGERLKSSDFQIVPDTPSSEQQGTIPPDKAGLYTLANESIAGVQKARNILFPKGNPESFNRTAATLSNPPGISLPWLGRVTPDVAPFSETGQNINRWLGNALAGRQLIQTGVAARPDETAGLVRRFMANVASDPKAIHEALNELEDFYKNYNNTLLTRKGGQVETSNPLNQTSQSVNNDSQTKGKGQMMIDAKGNKAMVYPDGSFEEIK